MVQETEIYGERDSLFKTAALTVVKTYHVTANNGADLNTNNLEVFLKDPKYGITTLGDDKYPICLCLAPKSKIEFIVTAETFYFTLVFLKRSGVDNIDFDTNQSMNIPIDDWVEMKQDALGFITALKTGLMADYNSKVRWTSIFQLGTSEGINVTRLTNFSGDKLSGVIISFVGRFNSIEC